MDPERGAGHLVEDVVLSPDQVREGKKSRKVAQKLIGNKLLRVVYSVDAKAYIIITAYYTRPGRYAA